MALATKYIAEFTDILGVDWQINIDEDGFAGTETTMQCSGNPFTIEHLSDSDDIYDSHIRGSRADLTVESDTDFLWTDLYAIQDQQFRMSIYYYSAGWVLYWQGYVITDNYQEPYNQAPYSVTISASDGLGTLKNYLYKYQTTVPDDTYYNGRRFESQIILDILGKLGITTFTEYVNVYEESMDSGVTDSPFDQNKIDVDIFKDMYCHEVLEEILKKYNAVIRSVKGVMTIYQPLKLNDTVKGRVFTAVSTKSAARRPSL
jgi:hypothetical protein